MRSAAACLGALGCTPVAPLPESDHATIEARSSTGETLAGVELVLGGRVAAKTDVHGRAVVELPPAIGASGDHVRVSVRCPPEYQAVPDSITVLRRGIRTLDARAEAIASNVTCKPIAWNVAIVVSSRGVPRCPVVLDGARLGETDDHGFAHLLVRAAPETRAVVELRGPPDGGPSEWRLSRSFRVPDHDLVVTLEGRPVKPRRRASFAAGPQKLYRIQ